MFEVFLKNRSQVDLQLIDLSNNLLTKEMIVKVICPFLEDTVRSNSLEHLILDKNPKILNSGFIELQDSLLLRMKRMNHIDYKSKYNFPESTVVMPLLSLSMSNTGLNDHGLNLFS